MERKQKPANPPKQNPEAGNATEPQRKEPASPGQYRSGIDQPGAPSKKNPGHANPAHNTPGDTRQDKPGQQEHPQPGQGRSQSYPGIEGRKTRQLKENTKPPTDGSADKHPETLHPKQDSTAKR